MFIGHFAVGLASKYAAPKTSLGWLVAAPLFLDLIWPALVLAGVETFRIEPGATAVNPLVFVRYPISHSLAMAVAWAILMAIVYWAGSRYRAGALVLASGVVSHWVFDAIVHTPDLPLYPGSGVKAGLGLWNSMPGTIAVEGLLFAAGVWVYAVATRSRDRAGSFAFIAFVAVLAILYAANLFGPPPPSVNAVAVVGLSGWLFPFWAAWFDRHRATAAHALYGTTEKAAPK